MVDLEREREVAGPERREALAAELRELTAELEAAKLATMQAESTAP